MSKHTWIYVGSGSAKEETVGPISEAELVKLVRSGKLQLDTRVASQTRTKGKWLKLQQISNFVKIHEEGQSERQAASEKARHNVKQQGANVPPSAAEVNEDSGTAGIDDSDLLGELPTDEPLSLATASPAPAAREDDEVLAQYTRPVPEWKKDLDPSSHSSGESQLGCLALVVLIGMVVLGVGVGIIQGLFEWFLDANAQ